jgi:transposase
MGNRCDGGGGLHCLAVCGRGDHRGGLRGAPAEPADTQAARGRKRHAKTDRSDARMLRESLQSGDLPESWIPPTAVLEWRERVRLYKSLVDQRRVWTQRIHAELFQHGVAVPEAAIRSVTTRERLTGDEVTLTPAGRQRVRDGYSMLEATDVEAQSLKRDLQRFGHRQPSAGRWWKPTTASAGSSP